MTNPNDFKYDADLLCKASFPAIKEADGKLCMEAREQAREKNEILIIKSTGAAIALGEATAAAIKSGHCNGEMEAALEYARKVKHEQKDFLTEQGVSALY